MYDIRPCRIFFDYSNWYPTFQAVVGFSKKCSKKVLNICDKSERARCLQLWDSKRENSTTEKVIIITH